jgi:hypothetical protein
MNGTDREQAFLDGVFKAVLPSFISNGMETGQAITAAYDTAEKALKERGARKLSRFFKVLENYNGIDALKRILRMDGNGERVIDHLIREYYIREPDPLYCYSINHIGNGKSAGQHAISIFLNKRNATKTDTVTAQRKPAATAAVHTNGEALF